MNTDVSSQLQQHTFSGLQQTAALKALQKVQTENGTLRPDDVADWLAALWPERGEGVVDPLTATKALQAFCDRTSLPRPSASTDQSFSVGTGAMNVRFAAEDDGRDWRSAIDQRSIDARLVTFESDVQWLFSLDLRSPEDYEKFGKWAGWSVSEDTFKNGSSWSDETVQHWATSCLASRHRIPRGVARLFLEQTFTDNAQQRTQQSQLFSLAGNRFVREALEREAVFDAFLEAIPVLKERVAFGKIDEKDLRGELERELGLEVGAISPREFRFVLEGYDPKRSLTDLKRIGYIQVMFSQHVLQEVTDNRIADALIDSGLWSQLENKTMDDAQVVEALEKRFSLPVGAIESQVYWNGKRSVPLFLESREQYGR